MYVGQIITPKRKVRGISDHYFVVKGDQLEITAIYDDKVLAIPGPYHNTKRKHFGTDALFKIPADVLFDFEIV